MKKKYIDLYSDNPNFEINKIVNNFDKHVQNQESVQDLEVIFHNYYENEQKEIKRVKNRPISKIIRESTNEVITPNNGFEDLIRRLGESERFFNDIEKLNLIQNISYRGYVILARKTIYLLRNHRYSIYSITKKPYTPLVKSNKNILDFHKPIDGINEYKIIHFSKDVIVTPSKSIRMRVTQFICELKKKSEKNELPFSVIFSEIDKNKRYFIPYLNWLEFTLFYIYQEGLMFSDVYNSKSRSPKFLKNNSCSEASFKQVVRFVLKMIEDFLEDEKNIDYSFVITQLYRIDNLFMIFKMCNIANYYRIFTSEKRLEYVCMTFPLEYVDIINLKKIIIDGIFKDEGFISKCLLSSFHTPFFVFDIIFMNYLDHFMKVSDDSVYDYRYRISGLFYSIEKVFSYCKSKTLSFLKYYDYKQSDQNSYSYFEGDLNLLLDEEDSILDNVLYEDYFYDYYFWNNDILRQYVDEATKPVEDEFEKEVNEYMSFLFKQAQKVMPDSLFT